MKRNQQSPLTKPLTRKRFRKELRSATRSQFRPLKRELKKAKRISLAQSQLDSRYFKEYKRSIGRAANTSQAAFNQAQQSGLQYARAAGANDRALQSQLGSEQAQQASLYGGSASAAPQNLAAAGQNSRAIQGGNMAQAVGNIGATAQTMFGSQKANAKLGRIEALNRGRDERRTIAEDMMDLKRERGDFRNEYTSAAREGERQFYLALKELRNANRQAAKDRAFQSSEAAKDRRASRRASKGEDQAEKDGSKAERKKAFNKAMALLGGFENPNKIRKSPKQAVAGLVNEGIPTGIARRAVDRWLKKHGEGKGGEGKGDWDWPR